MTTPPVLRYLVLLLLLALPAGAQINYVMKVPGITSGSSQLTKFPGTSGWMAVQGFAFGTFRQVSVTPANIEASAPEPGTLNVYMLVDPKTLPLLYLSALNGNQLGDGTDGSGFTIQAVQSIQGSNAATFILGIGGLLEAIECEGNSGDAVFVNLSIRLTKLTIKTIPINPDGSLDTAAAVAKGWDFQANVPF